MHRRHKLLHAVRKLTREVTTLGMESVLPWYKGKGSEMDYIKVTPSRLYLYNQFSNCMQKSVTSVHHSWSVRLKKPRTILLWSNIPLQPSKIKVEILYHCHFPCECSRCRFPDCWMNLGNLGLRCSSNWSEETLSTLKRTLQNVNEAVVRSWFFLIRDPS